MTITIITMDVVRLRASKQFEEAEEPRVRWEIKVADALIPPDSGEEDAPKARPLYASLAADGPDAWGDIDISALTLGADSLTVEESRDELQGSPVLEVLYDFARTHLQSVLGATRADYRLPISAPHVDLEVLRLDDARKGEDEA